VSSLQKEIESIRTELNLNNLRMENKMESGFKKVHIALEASLYSPGMLSVWSINQTIFAKTLTFSV
jgi:hypothetical protein